MKRSLNAKVSLLATTLVVVIGLASTAFLLVDHQRGQAKVLVSRGTTMAGVLARGAAEGIATGNQGLIQQVKASIQAEDVLLAQVYSSAWPPIAAHSADTFSDAPDPAALAMLREKPGVGHVRQGGAIDFYAPVHRHHLERPGEPKDTIGYVRLRLSTGQADADLRRHFIAYLAGSLLLTALAVLALQGLLRQTVLRPIESLDRAISEAVEKSCFEPVALSGQDEIGGLSANFNRMLAAIRDREHHIQRSEEMFATAFRVSPDAINITHLKDGQYLEVNEGFTAMTGYAPAEVVGRTGQELNLWVDPQDRDRLVRDLAEKGVINNQEAQLRRKDGSVLTGIISARRIEIRGEAGLLTITRDISDRKRAEEVLRESEANLRTLMDLIPVGIWWYGEEDRVQYVNRCFTDQFGYTLDEIPTLNDWILKAYPEASYRDRYLGTRNAAFMEARRSGSTVPPREAKVRCKDGTQRLIIITTRFVLGRTVEIFMDITEREHVGAQLQKIEKLEAVGVLAGGIAHDFNNILTAILGNISFARTCLEPSHKVTDILGKAERAAARAAELAHQLLTFAKGGQPIKHAASMRNILEESVSLVLRGANVSCTMDLPDDLMAVEVDPGQISQVVNNIVINATQAMPGGGTITIRGANLRVGAVGGRPLAPGDYVGISISDTGCGISEEMQKRIFDPYFTTKSGGSGLGLASAHSIIAKHGGSIGVRSEPGRGTTFELLLPASSQPVVGDAADAAQVTRRDQGGYSVLVMDDEEIIRELIAEMLTESGYQVQTCSHGEEAISLYRAARALGSPFSVVIMDLTIPGGMGGKEAAQHILAQDPQACLVVSSGYSNDPVMADFRQFGFRATLTKPYSFAGVMKVLTSLLAT